MLVYQRVINQQPTTGTNEGHQLVLQAALETWASNRGILSSPDLQHEAHGFTSGKGTVLGIGDA